MTALDEWRLSIFGSKMVMLYMPNRHHTRAAATFIDHVLARVGEAAAQTDNKPARQGAARPHGH